MPLSAMLDLAEIGGTMTLKGPLQSENKGEKRYVWVAAFRHKSECEIDPSTGLPKPLGPVGKKTIVKQTPFVITKKLDYTTPKLHAAFKDGTELNPWRLDLWHIPMSGPANNYFSIILKGAKIQSIRTIKPTMHGQNLGAAHELEEVAFSYSKIDFRAMPSPRGLSYGNQPNDSFEYDSKMEPDWKWVKAQALVQSQYKLYSDKLKAAVTAKLVEKGVVTLEGLPGPNFNQ